MDWIKKNIYVIIAFSGIICFGLLFYYKPCWISQKMEIYYFIIIPILSICLIPLFDDLLPAIPVIGFIYDKLLLFIDWLHGYINKLIHSKQPSITGLYKWFLILMSIYTFHYIFKDKEWLSLKEKGTYTITIKTKGNILEVDSLMILRFDDGESIPHIEQYKNKVPINIIDMCKCRDKEVFRFEDHHKPPRYYTDTFHFQGIKKDTNYILRLTEK